MELDVLAFAAHRDDTEITCGGTLIKMADLGYKVGAVDLTQGEKGTRGSAKERAAESEAASKVMGLVHRENLNLPDAMVEVSYENKLKVADAIRRLKPRVIIASYWEGRHPDHYNASRLATEASFLAGLKKLEIGGEPHRPFKIIYTMPFQGFNKPSFIVDITDQFKRKMEAIKCYKSQFLVQDEGGIFPPWEDLYDRFYSYFHYCGTLIFKKYGEAFIVKEAMEIEDIVKMPVRSV